MDNFVRFPSKISIRWRSLRQTYLAMRACTYMYVHVCTVASDTEYLHELTSTAVLFKNITTLLLKLVILFQVLGIVPEKCY
jgi:hypothetical protein